MSMPLKGDTTTAILVKEIEGQAQMLDQLPLIQLLNPAMSDAYRSAGIGKLLSHWMEEEARRHQCDTIMLDAYVTNSAGHRFYFREGFHIKSYHFYKNL